MSQRMYAGRAERLPSARLLALVAVVLAVAPAPAAHAQWFKDARTFTLFEENDALTKTGDESYTQGLRMTWDFSQWPDWASHLERRIPLRRVLNTLLRRPSRPALIACVPQTDRAAHPCGSVSFGLGQTQYSPADITTGALQPADRPYAGWLFGTMALNVRDGPLQTSTEAVVGILGPQSHAQSFQSFAHWTWSSDSPQPQGWHHQLRNSAHVGVIAAAAYHAYERCAHGPCTSVYGEGRRFDITPRVELIGTTAVSRASAGLTVRAGKNFPDAAFGQRIPATGRSMSDVGRSWWWAAFATADVRAVGHNALLEGSYADRGPADWKARRQIEARDAVDEWSYGLGIGNRAGSVSFQRVSRTEEFDPLPHLAGVSRPRGRHIYGSVTFSINALPK